MSSIQGRAGSVYAPSSIAGGSGSFSNAISGGEVLGTNWVIMNGSGDAIRLRILERGETSTIKAVVEVRIGAGWIPTGIEFDSGVVPG